MGDTITEADVRLFTTLARFDAVYHGHFKCNRQKLSEMPVLWAYARDLFQTPGFGDTTDFVQIKQHYYIVHEDINPTGIVPAGPDLGGWLTAARPRGARRPAVRRRHAARAGPGRRGGRRRARALRDVGRRHRAEGFVHLSQQRRRPRVSRDGTTDETTDTPDPPRCPAALADRVRQCRARRCCGRGCSWP